VTVHEKPPSKSKMPWHDPGERKMYQGSASGVHAFLKTRYGIDHQKALDHPEKWEDFNKKK
jgi:hypothetical protein